MLVQICETYCSFDSGSSVEKKSMEDKQTNLSFLFQFGFKISILNKKDLNRNLSRLKLQQKRLCAKEE